MIMERIATGIVDFVDECARAKLVNIIAWVLLVSLVVLVFTMDIYGDPPAFVTDFF